MLLSLYFRYVTIGKRSHLRNTWEQGTRRALQERRAAERGGGTRPRKRERGLGGSGRRSRAVLNAPRILGGPCGPMPRRAAFAPWFVFLLLVSFCFLFFARLREPAALRERALLLRCEGKARKVRCFRSYCASALLCALSAWARGRRSNCRSRARPDG